MKARRLYLASPLGFSAVGGTFREELHQGLEAIGFEVVDPWDVELPAPSTREAALQIGRLNVALLEQCDVVVGVLDGADVDSGVALELGYAAALGKTVHGLRTDVRLAGECAELGINLQVATAIADSGGRLLRRLEDLPSILPERQEEAA